MPSLGHVAVGLAAGRLHAGTGSRSRVAPTLVFTALALFPDLDVVARQLGAGRASIWLHRGALHSIAVAVLAGLAAACLAGGLGRAWPRTAATAALVALSHGVLDTITRGGRGVMLLWPFDETRFLAPWPLLAAAPIGARLASTPGVAVLVHEAVLFSPLLVYALWPARRLIPGSPSSSSCEGASGCTE